MRVTVNHLRAAGVCGRGARPWAASHGIDWRDFVRNGVDIEVLRATGDAMALKCVRVAEAEAANEQG